jgi:beta-lactamase class A
MVRIAGGELVSGAVSDRLAQWMLLNTDMSMVGSAFGLDPLSHTVPDRETLVRNKTGTDAGVRADVGFVVRGAQTVAYAVLANWTDMRESVRDEVLGGMGRIGSLLRTWLAR